MIDMIMVGALYFLSGALFISGLRQETEMKLALGAVGVALGLFFGTLKLLTLLS